jgi:hypothetical protein
MSLYRQHNLLQSFNYCLLYLATCFGHSTRPSLGFSEEVFHTEYNYTTTILKLYYVPYEISYSVHYGCMVVEIQVVQILYSGGAR